MNNKNIAEQIADWLVSQGITDVFTVTGGGAMFLNQALGSHPEIRCTFMHHEQACAMAAEAYARIAKKPAVVMLTTGPGAINALNGVYGAYTDSVPMIVLSGQVKSETCISFYNNQKIRQLGDQEGPIIAMAQPVCKYAELIRTASQLNTALPTALHVATKDRPGPVWLDIPLDIQSSKEQLIVEQVVVAQNRLPGSSSAHIDFTLEKIRHANRPLILVGTGIHASNSERKLLEVIEKLQIPTVTAWSHDLIPSDHYLFAGRQGTIGDRAGNFCVQNCDLLLVLGSRLSIRQISYNFKKFAKNAFVIQVDIDEAELSKPTFSADYPIKIHLDIFLEELFEKSQSSNLPDFSSWIFWCRNLHEEFQVIDEHQQLQESPVNPYWAVSQIFEQLNSDDVIACGNASACILPFQVGNIKPGQRMFSNSGAASMGYDLPAAIGASIATGRKKLSRVICFAGDGSLQMNIQELQTLKTLDLNIIIIVLNNNGYSSIKQTHKNFFGKIIGATPESGIEFPSFKKIALAYGIKAEEVRTSSELKKVLSQISDCSTPLLLEVYVDPECEFIPRIKSRTDEYGNFLTPELDDMYPFLDQERLESIRQSSQQIYAKNKNDDKQ